MEFAFYAVIISEWISYPQKGYKRRRTQGSGLKSNVGTDHPHTHKENTE